MCGLQGLDRAMDATTLRSDAEHELDAELQTWDWARAAGVSADDLRLAVQALLPATELLQAA